MIAPANSGKKVLCLLVGKSYWAVRLQNAYVGTSRYTQVTSTVRAVRIDGRRKDTPAVLLSRINQILKAFACNDENW